MNVVLYKRCGRRDDKAFEEFQSIFWNYQQEQHLKAMAFLATQGIAPSMQALPPPIGTTAASTILDPGKLYIATHIRTEKWGGVSQMFGESCALEFEDNFITVLSDVLSKSLNLKTLFLATDAMPGGAVTSVTYSEKSPKAL